VRLLLQHLWRHVLQGAHLQRSKGRGWLGAGGWLGACGWCCQCVAGARSCGNTWRRGRGSKGPPTMLRLWKPPVGLPRDITCCLSTTSAAASAAEQDRPKSASLTEPSADIRMLAGLMSLQVGRQPQRR
jgi:hypothetical protein